MNQHTYDFSHWGRRLPKASCLCPTYGRPHLIGEAVESFLRQDYLGEKELIILNDHPDIPLELPDLPGVKIINTSSRYPNLGEKRNALAALATGDVYFPWDDDDISLPHRLSSTLSQMKNCHYFKPSDLWWWTGGTVEYKQGVAAHAMAAYSRSLFEMIGGYPAMNSGEDQEIERKIEMTGYRKTAPVGVADCFYVYRMNQTDTYHISAHAYGGGWSECAAHVSQQLEAGQRIITPGWNHEYTMLAAKKAVYEEARLEVYGEGPQLSICVSLKNRSRIAVGSKVLNLFPNCLRSIGVAAAGMGPVEVVIADFGSDDWPLSEWIPRNLPGLDVKVINAEGSFSRGRGLNLAAAAATGRVLMLSDADLLISEDALRHGLAAVEAGSTSFPMFRHLREDGTPAGLEVDGFGIVFISPALFHAVGGMPEFESWGGEDNLFHDRISRISPVIREGSEGLRHQWHPEICRHQHYANQRRHDYQAYLSNPEHRQKFRMPRSKSAYPQIRIFIGSHPGWTGPLHLIGDRILCRPGIDHGLYELEEGNKITLHWNDWPSETLGWDDDQRHYRSATVPFTLTEVDLTE